ncbi:MAG: lysylphosphatidylglycerol synthase transmembrane domain-containing protein [Candidatus Eisenbacteria bacterium]|nr:lysylphosphatidylglycerol synthase transmembrane domain-containing protein [Candidatus Eisenbacteria bacterium]
MSKPLRTGTLLRILGVVLSVFLLWLAFRGIAPGEILRSLLRVSPFYLTLALMGNLLLVVFKTLKWRLILGPVKRVSLFNLFSASLIGFASSNLLPAKVGELTKVYAVCKSESLGALPVLGTVALDRVLEGAAMVLVMFFVFASTDVPGWLKSSGLSVSVISLILLPVLYVMASTRLGERFSFLARLKQGFMILRSPASFVSAFLLSILIWCIHALILQFFFLAYGLTLPVWAPILFLVVVNLAIAVPSLPSAVGALEYAGITSLLYMGVDRDLAASLVLLYHFVMSFPVTVLGIVAFLHSGLRLTDVTKDYVQKVRGEA